MCHTFHYLNNKNYKPEDHLSPWRFKAFCGKCGECRESRISEVLFRTEQHDAWVRKNHGFACFVTLTFNEHSLNYITIDDGQLISTWNNKLLKRWCDRLQHKLNYNDYKVSYYATAERGDNHYYIDDKGRKRKASQRPHYHVIVWFTPTSENRIDEQFALDSITTSWSWSRKHNKVAVPLPDSKGHYGRYLECSHEPVGRVYNELVCRKNSTHKAMKYIVKYCFKNDKEELFNFPKDNILTSKFPLSYLDFLPSNHSSNGIGLSWLNDHPITEDNIDDIISQVYFNTDGSKTVLPRYYLKKVCHKTHTLSTDYILDESKVWSKVGYDYKYNQSIFKIFEKPIQIAPGDPLTNTVSVDVLSNHYRVSKKTETIRTDIGEVFALKSLNKKATDLYKTIQSWSTVPFNMESIDYSNQPWFQFFNETLRYRFIHLTSMKSEIYNQCMNMLKNLDINRFTRIFRVMYHWKSFMDYYKQYKYREEVFKNRYNLFTYIPVMRNFLEYYEMIRQLYKTSCYYERLENYKKSIMDPDVLASGLLEPQQV